MDLAARRGSPNERTDAMHDAGCIDAAKATFREEMHATLTAPVWDAEAMEAEEAYVDSWAREWLANGTKSCECRGGTHEHA